MTARVTGQRFRQRKLSTKQSLPVLREHEIEQLADDDASRHIPKVETGVEKGEEIVSSTSFLTLNRFRCHRNRCLPIALHDCAVFDLPIYRRCMLIAQ